MKLLRPAGLVVLAAMALAGCHRFGNGRTVSPVIVPTVPGQASAEAAATAASGIAMAPAMPQPRITIDPRDTVLQVVNADLRGTGGEEQVIAVKRISDVDSPVRILVADVDPQGGTYYFQSWESATNATDNRIFNLAVKDLLGQHDVQIVATGMNREGKLTLDVFRRVTPPRGDELVYASVCQIVADDIHVVESDRPDSYVSDRKDGPSFPIDTFIHDPDSQNVTDLLKITYQWNPQEGRYVPGPPEKVPGEKIAQAQLSKLFNSTAPESFEDFLGGSWVETSSDPAHPIPSPSVLSFDPRLRKIALSTGDTQEVYTWRVTVRTIYNSAYLIGDNETVPQISRTFIVTALSAVTLSVSIQGSDAPDRPAATYTRISEEMQAKLLGPGTPAPPQVPALAGEYTGPNGLRLIFQYPILRWKDSSGTRSAEYVLFPLAGHVILSVRFFGGEERSWVVDFKESKNPARILRSLTLSPAQLTVQGYEDAVGDTLTLRQELELRAR